MSGADADTPADLDSDPLHAAWLSACARYPELSVEQDRYRGFVRQRLEDATPNEDGAADLYLACACLDGDSKALALFERHYLSLVPQFLARLDTSPHGGDEVQQMLRDRLLVAKGDRPPKLADYAGRGRLVSWLRVVTIRTALNLVSGHNKRPTADADQLMSNEDPELDHLRKRYQEQFQQAFTLALTALGARDRTLLRLQLIDQLNIDQIGQLFEVHRATAARWLAAARDQLFEQTRSRLRKELGLSATEFASIVRLVRSQLDVSICRILEQEPE